MLTRSPFVQVASTLSKLALLLILATALASGTVINSTSVAGNRLKITGTGFAGTPTVVFNGTTLAIESNTDTQIAATLNPVPAPGTYRLVVKAGSTSAVSYVNISKNPKIVKQLALTHQTASIPATILLTPRADGLYRVSTYITSTFGNGSAGEADLYMFWTDDSGAGQCLDYTAASIPCVTVWAGMFTDTPTFGSASNQFTIRALAGTPITYNVVYGPPAVYELFITVEQLQ
jgi:hypothetical protein